MQENTREAARRMIADGMPLEKVARLAEMDMEAIQKLAVEVTKGQFAASK
jgi:hypothetical protein